MRHYFFKHSFSTARLILISELNTQTLIKNVFSNLGPSLANTDYSSLNEIRMLSVYDVISRIVGLDKVFGNLELSYNKIRYTLAKIYYINFKTSCGSILKNLKR